MSIDLVDPDLDRVFHALADPGRRRMLDRLSREPASVSELGKPLAITLAATVQHVQILEASGLVRTQKRGRTRICCLETEGLRSAEHWLAERRSLIERRLDRLGVHLAENTDRREPAAQGDPRERPVARTAPERGPE